MGFVCSIDSDRFGFVSMVPEMGTYLHAKRCGKPTVAFVMSMHIQILQWLAILHHVNVFTKLASK